MYCSGLLTGPDDSALLAQFEIAMYKIGTDFDSESKH